MLASTVWDAIVVLCCAMVGEEGIGWVGFHPVGRGWMDGGAVKPRRASWARENATDAGSARCSLLSQVGIDAAHSSVVVSPLHACLLMIDGVPLPLVDGDSSDLSP